MVCRIWRGVLIALIFYLNQGFGKQLPCYDNNSALDELTFNGQLLSLDTSTTFEHVVQKCVVTCNGYLQRRIDFKYAIIYQNICFCMTSSKFDLKETSEDFEQCSLTSCNTLLQTCRLTSYTLVNLKDSIRSVALNFTAINIGEMVDLPKVIIPQGTPSDIQYRWKADGEMLSSFQANQKSKHMFLTPGHKRMTIEVKNSLSMQMSHTEFIKVNDNKTNVHFATPRVMEPGTKYMCNISILSGTDIDAELSVRINNEEEKVIHVEEDVYSFARKLPVSLSYETQQGTIPQQQDGVFVNPSISFEESGILSQLEIIGNRGGMVELIILRPKCQSDIYCLSKYQCDCTDYVDLNVSPDVTETNDAIDSLPNLVLIHAHSINIEKIGYQVVSLQKLNMLVRKGDILSLAFSKEGGMISFRESKLPTFVYHSKQQQLRSTQYNRKLRISPMVRPYCVKPFIYRVQLKPKSVGEVVFKFKNSTVIQLQPKSVGEVVFKFKNSTVTEKVVLVQEKVKGLAFMPNHPKKPAYDLNDRFIEIKANVTRGSHVIYLFEIPTLNQTVSTSDGIAKFKITKVGQFTVYVNASNMLNSENVTTNVKVMDQIDETTLSLSNATIKNNKELHISIHIFNGTDVTLEIDFGDGSDKLFTYIGDARKRKGILKYFTHRYKMCDTYTITAITSNPLNEDKGGHKITKDVTVTCGANLNNITLYTFPEAYNDIVSFALVRQLFLVVGVPNLSEKKVDCILSWGDEATEEHTLISRRTVFNHTYNNTGNFSIRITILGMDSQKEMMVSVQVTKCGSPIVAFSYGSEKNPEVYTKSTNKKIIGTWNYYSKECQDRISPIFDFFSWKLIPSDDKYKLKFDPNTRYNYRKEDQVVEYEIKKGDLDEGSYKILLTMSYNKNFTEQYIGFIAIVKSKLIPILINGIHATVPYKIMTSDLNTTTHQFQIDARPSIDPDQPKAKVENMTFQWSCKVKSSEDEVAMAIFQTENKLRNKSIDFNTCNHQEFQSVGNQSALLTFDTAMFLEGIEYIFSVIVRKGNRSSSTQQILELSTGTTPPINLECTNNCGEKVNINERFILRYSCEKCSRHIKLKARWLVLSSVGERLSHPNMTLTGFEHPNLVIKANTLKPNETYTFKLNISYAGMEKQALFIINRTTSITPSRGYCKIDPEKGTALQRFKLWCSKWTNFDQPTLYEFRYNLHGTKSINDPIINPSSIDSNEISGVVFPPGLKSRDYKINIYMKVLNRFRQYQEFPLHVWVTPIASNESISSLYKELLPDDLTDTRAVTSSVMALSSVFNDTKRNTQEEKVSFGDEEQEEFERENKAREAEARRKVKSDIINILNQLEIKNPSELKAVADALSEMTNDADDLNENSQQNGINLVSKLTSTMADMQREGDVGAEQVENSMTAVFSSVSNLFTNEVANVEKGIGEYSSSTTTTTTTTTTTQQPSVEAQRKVNNSVSNINNLVSNLDKGFSLVAENQVTGQQASVGQTPSFNYGVQKASPEDMQDMKVGDGESGFGLPSGDSMFGDSNTEPLSVLNVNYENNVFVADVAGAQNVKSKVASLSFKAGNRELKVNNTKTPIVIKLQNKPEDLTAKIISLFMPGKTKMHAVKLDSMQCNLMLNIKPVSNFQGKADLNIYVQYGRPPTKKLHDFKLTIRDGQEIDLIKNKDPVNKTNNKLGNFSSNTSFSNVSLERRSHVQVVDNNTVMLWNFLNFTYGFMNNSRLYLAFTYNGSMPDLRLEDNPYTFDMIEYRGAYNYSLKSFCADCSYWNENETKWMKDGCSIMPNESSLQTTVCHCNHLTAFGSFFVAPNPLPTPSLALLKEGYVLFVTVGSILLLYVVGLVLARRADKRDETKVGVCPLPDNRPEHKYLYEITVNTGSRLRSGTKSKIFVNVIGDLQESGIRYLNDSERTPFQRCSSDVFVMATESSLGGLSALRVFHDNSGGGWYLRHEQNPQWSYLQGVLLKFYPNKSIEVVDLQTDMKYSFIASRWLAVEMQDGQVDVSFPVCGQSELKDFKYLFVNKARRDLTDAHLWFSIYGRPPRSSFNRCQRLSVAISLLFTHMVANLMFYGAIPPGSPSSENKVGAFTINLQQIYIAVVSACICIPVNIILVFLFRSIRPSSLSPIKLSPFALNKSNGEVSVSKPHNNNNESIRSNGKANGYVQINITDSGDERDKDGNIHEKMACTEHLLKGSESNDESNAKKKKRKKSALTKMIKKEQKKKEKFYLPHWLIYPAWVLNIAVILGCGFMVIWYGMAFGNKKSLEWLTSVTIGLVQDILVIQPVKVFIMATFVALIIKKLDEEEKSEIEKRARVLAKNEEWLHQSYKEESGCGETYEVPPCPKPPTRWDLKRARELRVKEMQMKSIGQEMFFYLLFAFIVFVLGMSTRDFQAYSQTTSMKEILQIDIREYPSWKVNYTKYRYHKANRKSMIWDYVERVLLPTLYPEEWYTLNKAYENESFYSFPEKLLLIDLNSKIVTGARIRQVRVEEDSCKIPKKMRPAISIPCLGNYERNAEDKENFDYSWKKVSKSEHLKIHRHNMPWKYQGWKEMDSYPVRGEYNLYFGGGYAQEVFPKWNNTAALEKIKQKLWIDRQSRAIIIEFAVFNAATNYFQNVEIIFELPPTGGVVHYSSITTFKLYSYTSKYGTLILLSEIAFILFMLYFTVRESRQIYLQRGKYFKDFWNLVEVTNIILSILAVGFYFYKYSIARGLFHRMPDKQPQSYISMQFASFWDLTYTNIVALISFFVTLKFIKLLRFNRRIGMLSSTLKRAWYPLSLFGIVLGIVLISCTIFAWMIFGRQLFDYKNFFRSLASIFSLLLGKFSYDEFHQGNRFLGPLFFFCFSIMVNWIIMNMFIAILNDILAEVSENEDLQTNEYEMVDYFMKSFKDLLGIGNKKSIQNDQKPKCHIEPAPEMDYSFLETRFFTEDIECIIPGDKMEKEELDETIDKFINCFNSLYFDDVTVAQRMNKVVKDEIKKKCGNG